MVMARQLSELYRSWKRGMHKNLQEHSIFPAIERDA